MLGNHKSGAAGCAAHAVLHAVRPKRARPMWASAFGRTYYYIWSADRRGLGKEPLQEQKGDATISLAPVFQHRSLHEEMISIPERLEKNIITEISRTLLEYLILPAVLSCGVGLQGLISLELRI